MRRIVILSGLALALAAVCSCDSGGASAIPDAGPPDFYPIAVGSWWEYDELGEYGTQRSRYDITGTETVEFDYGIGTRTVFLRERTYPTVEWEGRTVEYLEDDGERVVRYRELYYDATGALDWQRDDDPGFLKFDRTRVSVGDQWEWELTSYLDEFNGLPIVEEGNHYVYEVMSIDEVVTVPAGTFICILIRRVNAVGTDPDIRQYYYSPGLGKVKENEEGDAESAALAELTAYGIAPP